MNRKPAITGSCPYCLVTTVLKLVSERADLYRCPVCDKTMGSEQIRVWSCVEREEPRQRGLFG